VYKGDLWRDHADGYAIAPGITVLRTPGHTEEDASLVVETADGTYVLTHLWCKPRQSFCDVFGLITRPFRIIVTL